MRPIFITGNQYKADYLSKLLGISLEHQKVELDELQSLDLHTIVNHKVKQAYRAVGRPVLVEDVSLEFHALGKLPGTFIKFFVEEDLEKTCRILDSFSDRRAVARCTFGYFDGNEIKLFDGRLNGTIAEHPRGENGYGWDQIFEPEGSGGKTRAELTQAENETGYLLIKPINAVHDFLSGLQ